MESEHGVRVTATVIVGNAAASIIEESCRFAPDLLLIATHGRGGEAKWRLGGVAAKVVRQVRTDTLVVPSLEVAWTPRFRNAATPAIRTILVPVDGSRASAQALEQASRLAMGHQALIHVVTVVPDEVWGQGFRAFGIESLQRAYTDSARKYLEDIVATLDGRLSGKAAVLFGPVASQLHGYIEAIGIDLVVMVKHSASPFEYAYLGSVTDRMLGGPAPVLIVQPRPTQTPPWQSEVED
jgi:nucleotide-binding universal stress UspA family protein